MTRQLFPGFGTALTGVATIGLALTASAVWAAETATRPVTFSKDVAPIFQQKCQECHQPNSIAPMSLITFAESRPWAAAIRQRVSTRQMPPWHIDPSVGVHKFKNDMSLSQEQIDTIVRWVESGALGRRSERSPAGEAARHRQRMAGRPRRVWSSRPGHPIVGVHNARAAPGRLVSADERSPADRAALGEDGRDSSNQSERTPNRPPFDCVPGPQQRSRGRE